MKKSEFTEYVKNDVIVCYINKDRGYELCNFLKVQKGYVFFTDIHGSKYADKPGNVKKYNPKFFITKKNT